MEAIPDLNRSSHFVVARFFRWLFSRRIMRRVLIGFAGLSTVIAAYYARADWLGKRVWEDWKREVAAKGEVWDWSAFGPAPVPGDQDIFQLPKLAVWFGDNLGLIAAPL